MDLPNPGIEPRSPALQADSLPAEPPGKPNVHLMMYSVDAEYIMRNTGLEEAQAGIKIAGRNMNNLSYAHDTTLMAESEEETLDESERGEWKSWLKAQHLEN